MDKKSRDAFRTISEVSEWLDTPAHVLRFWESKFTQVKPVKRAGGRRYYRPADMLLLGGIKKLLHDDGLTIRGVQKILREQGVKHVSTLSAPLDEDGVVDATASEDVTVDHADETVAPPADTKSVDSSPSNVVPLKPTEDDRQPSLDFGDVDKTTPPETAGELEPATDTVEAAPQGGAAREEAAPPLTSEGPTKTAPEPDTPDAPSDTATDGAAPQVQAADEAPATPAEIEPESSPAPLGADLPASDVTLADLGDVATPLTVILRQREVRRALKSTQSDALAGIVTRMRTLSDRMSKGA